MGRKPFSQRLFRTAFCFSIRFLGLFSQTGSAQDALNFFKNYFVTGDYVAGGVGLRGTGKQSASGDPCLDQLNFGKASGKLQGAALTEWQNLKSSCPTFNGSYAQNSITVTGVPVTLINGQRVPADIVAAFLYWQTDEPLTPARQERRQTPRWEGAECSMAIRLWVRWWVTHQIRSATHRRELSLDALPCGRAQVLAV